MFDGSRVLYLEPRSAFLPVPPPLAVVVFEHLAVQVLHPLPRFLGRAGIAVTARLVLGGDGMGWRPSGCHWLHGCRPPVGRQAGWL